VAHWLDEIERIENRKHRSASESARIQDKKFRIQQNYEKNRDIYDGFVGRLDNLVERVNNLPMEHREVFGKITGRVKDSKLNNHLHFFSSSRRTQKVQFKDILHPFKNIHFKHVRVIYFNIAKIMDKVEVEILEELLEKKRRDGKVVQEHEMGRDFKTPHSDKDKFHGIYYYDIEKLTDELAYQIIDWLAFREDLNHLRIIRDGEQRFQKK
jgi:Rad3-related DNA helicase